MQDDILPDFRSADICKEQKKMDHRLEGSTSTEISLASVSYVGGLET